jgi:hypothetical protein
MMRARRVAMVAATALSAGSMVVLSAAPASAHYREFPWGNAVGAVGENHRSVHLCELGPGIGGMIVQLTDGSDFGLIMDDGCTPSTPTARNVNAFKVGWANGGAFLWSGWVAP